MGIDHLVVYLDTQDFSRFGDVLRGKSDERTEKLFCELKRRRELGDVVFPLSMAIVSELFKYNEAYRETTYRKAEAAEILCGRWAVGYPTKVFKTQVLDVARSLGITKTKGPGPILTNDANWFPDMSPIFLGFKQKIQLQIDERIRGLGLRSRADRRRAKAVARRVNFREAMEALTAQAANELELPYEALMASLIPLMEGKINERQASKNLLESVGRPTVFIQTYFEKIETNRDLPRWIADTSRKLCSTLETISRNLNSLSGADTNWVLSNIEAQATVFSDSISDFCETDTAGESQITKEVAQFFSGNLDATMRIPAVKIIIRTFEAYLMQVTGMKGSRAAIEHSFGGDLVHALYIPHVDLWRGDRRFSHILAQAVPEYSDRIINSPFLLPGAIESALRGRATPAR